MAHEILLFMHSSLRQFPKVKTAPTRASVKLAVIGRAAVRVQPQLKRRAHSLGAYFLRCSINKRLYFPHIAGHFMVCLSDKRFVIVETALRVFAALTRSVLGRGKCGRELL
jgi:hypothetical protein